MLSTCHALCGVAEPLFAGKYKKKEMITHKTTTLQTDDHLSNDHFYLRNTLFRENLKVTFHLDPSRSLIYGFPLPEALHLDIWPNTKLFCWCQSDTYGEEINVGAGLGTFKQNVPISVRWLPSFSFILSHPCRQTEMDNLFHVRSKMSIL